MRFFSLVLLLLFASADVRAQELKALVLGAESNDSWLAEVSSTLLATGFFHSVDWINPASSTPSLATLLDYDSVLVWSDSGYANATELGNNLADYVDEGGGVVLGVWAVTNISSSHTLQGRWTAGNYRVMMNDASYITGTNSLGTVHEPEHPIMSNVTTFQGGSSSYRGIGTNLSAGSYRVADWNDGNILVAVNDTTFTPRVDVNFFPPSSASRADFWQASSDGDLILGQALVYVAGGGHPQLAITEAIPGAYMTFEMSRLRADSDVVTLLSSRGPGPTSTAFGEIEVTQPWFRTPLFRADSEGELSFSITLPAGAAGQTLYSQAVEFSEGNDPRLSVAVVLPIN